MARPRKDTADIWYDIFASMSVEDQKSALRVLETVHRLAERDAARKSSAKSAPEVSGDTNGADQPKLGI